MAAMLRAAGASRPGRVGREDCSVVVGSSQSSLSLNECINRRRPNVPVFSFTGWPVHSSTLPWFKLGSSQSRKREWCNVPKSLRLIVYDQLPRLYFCAPACCCMHMHVRKTGCMDRPAVWIGRTFSGEILQSICGVLVRHTVCVDVKHFKYSAEMVSTVGNLIMRHKGNPIPHCNT